jgi:hypothetical protein
MMRTMTTDPVCSMGTPMGLTCGLILMIPFEHITGNVAAHVSSVLSMICTSKMTVIMYDILNNHDTENMGRDLTKHLIMTVSIGTPLYLFPGVMSFEIERLLRTRRDDLSWIVVVCVADGIALFVNMWMTCEILRGRPVSFATMAHSVALALIIPSKNGIHSLIGASMIFIATIIHVSRLAHRHDSYRTHMERIDSHTIM